MREKTMKAGNIGRGPESVFESDRALWLVDSNLLGRQVFMRETHYAHRPF
jgi:hypothetical protein